MASESPTPTPAKKAVLTGTRGKPPLRGIFNIEDLREIPRPKFTSNSRYQPEYHIHDTTFTYMPTRRFVKPAQNPAQTFYTLNKGDEGRLDLIAYRFYKNVDLWWVIAQANGISNPRRALAGTVLVIPPIEQIFTEFIL